MRTRDILYYYYYYDIPLPSAENGDNCKMRIGRHFVLIVSRHYLYNIINLPTVILCIMLYNIYLQAEFFRLSIIQSLWVKISVGRLCTVFFLTIYNDNSIDSSEYKYDTMNRYNTQMIIL